LPLEIDVADMFLDAPDAYSALSNIRNYSQIYGILHLLATMTTPVVTMMDGIACKSLLS
jgi:3-hydroxyisobutyryl-CoA hydrolase